MEPNPPRIFISYSRRDGRQQAERLQAMLRAHNLNAWRDLQSMTAGDILPQALRAIEASEHLCLILSPAALASDWVKRESTHARLHAKSVCLILADSSLTRAGLPQWARRQQIFDLDNAEETNLLLETLRRPSQARRVPYMEGHLPEDFVPRPHEYAQLKAAILAASQTTIGLTTALRGAGGYGKTSLANYLCRDPDIRAEFSDGILRIDIGRERNDVTGSILELCDFLALPNTKRPISMSPFSPLPRKARDSAPFGGGRARVPGQGVLLVQYSRTTSIVRTPNLPEHPGDFTRPAPLPHFQQKLRRPRQATR